MSWNIKQEREEMDIVDNRSINKDSTIVDSEVIDDADVKEWGPEDGNETPSPEPALSFGTKAVLSAEETRKIVLDRIKEHESTIAAEECLLFECQHGQSESAKEELAARIAARYDLVQAYVNEYNRIYGGSENG